MNIVIPHHIAIPEKYYDALTELGAVAYDDTTSIELLKERISDADIITTRTLADAPIFDTSAAVIDAAPHLKYIITPSTGTNHIDVAYATSKGIQVLNCPTFNSQAVAEHAVSLMMAVNRNIVTGDKRLTSGVWDQSDLRGYELSGKKVGLIGYGHIGKILEKLCTGFGMAVSYTRSSSTDGDTDALLAASDFVIVCAHR